MAIRVRVEEDFEIVVAKNDRIVLSQCLPDVWLFQFGRDVECLVVPEHFHPRAQRRIGLLVPFDVAERLAPWRIRPGRVVQFTVDNDRRTRSITDVATWWRF